MAQWKEWQPFLSFCKRTPKSNRIPSVWRGQTQDGNNGTCLPPALFFSSLEILWLSHRGGLSEKTIKAREMEGSIQNVTLAFLKWNTGVRIAWIRHGVRKLPPLPATQPHGLLTHSHAHGKGQLPLPQCMGNGLLLITSGF